MCNEKAEAKQLHDAVSTALRLAQIKKSNCNEKATFVFVQAVGMSVVFRLVV